MKNEQIIREIADQIYEKETVRRLLEKGQEIPLHTMRGWAQRGYKLKEGERGIETKLWRKGRTSKKWDFYLCRSYLFRADQVEKDDQIPYEDAFVM